MKTFTCGNTTITRDDYESMPSPMNTDNLTDNDMQKLANAIEESMYKWNEWLKNGDVNQDQYNGEWWRQMESIGVDFGITYYEDV